MAYCQTYGTVEVYYLGNYVKSARFWAKFQIIPLIHKFTKELSKLSGNDKYIIVKYDEPIDKRGGAQYPIIMFDKNKRKINSFINIQTACKELNLPKHTILHSISHNSLVGTKYYFKKFE